jgi:hypothetical protein
MKYKLLKELPNAKAGEYTYLWDNIFSDWNTSFNIYKEWLDNPEWFEEIKETKSIYDLQEGDTFYSFWTDILSLTINWEVAQQHYKNLLEIGEVFLTKQEAETELAKRKAIATIKKWSYDNDWWYEFKSNAWNYPIVLIRSCGIDILAYDDENSDLKFHWTQYYSSEEVANQALKELEAEYNTLFQIK